jgi:NADH-quinone oxidoreductase subunit E
MLSETTIAELHELAGRYPQARSALLPMLHLIQSTEGHVTNEGVEICADILQISAAEVSGVATFYTMYKRRPMGRRLYIVCTNTLCAVMGGDLIFERLKGHLDVGNDETTEDGQVTLEHIECNAACDFAPVMTVNWEFFDNQTPESAVELVDQLRSGETVQATRGATITSWREAERVIAGFEDGLVNEGPTAAGASLAGLTIAKERGWAAPDYGSTDASGSSTDSSNEDAKEGAAEQADTSRAETETIIEQSPAKTSKEDKDD